MKVGIKDVSKKINGKVCLQKISMNLASGKISTIVGTNGAGKTTLLRLIAGLDNADEGSITYENDDGSVIKNPIISYIWQDYRSSNFPWLNVLDNILFPHIIKNKNTSDLEKTAIQWLAEFLPNVEAKSNIYNLSGGEQQVIAFFRAMLADSDILLADEPFSALDQARRWKFYERFCEIISKSNKSVLWVSHDINESILISDYIHLLSNKEHSIIETIPITTTKPRLACILTSPQNISIQDKIIGFLQNETL